MPGGLSTCVLPRAPPLSNDGKGLWGGVGGWRRAHAPEDDARIVAETRPALHTELGDCQTPAQRLAPEVIGMPWPGASFPTPRM